MSGKAETCRRREIRVGVGEVCRLRSVAAGRHIERKTCKIHGAGGSKYALSGLGQIRPHADIPKRFPHADTFLLCPYADTFPLTPMRSHPVDTFPTLLLYQHFA